MLPGPAIILSCPLCGGEKELMSITSGNTTRQTLWSDTRSVYPMLPELSQIQKCPQCNRYYFLNEAERKISDDPESIYRSSGKLGNLSYAEIKEAREQMLALPLSNRQRLFLASQLYLAYNDEFRRHPEDVTVPATEEDEALFKEVAEELLIEDDKVKFSPLFRTELMRSLGRFEEAKATLLSFSYGKWQWMADALLRHIEDGNVMPFLFIKDGKVVV